MINIIMCTYNGENYIKEQLDSIANNGIKDWRLYVSDDCSTDNTLVKVKEFQQQFPERVYIKRNMKQKGAVINFLKTAYEVGSLMADDDFIMFCDQDDVWGDSKIEITLQEMDKMIADYGNKIPLLVCSDVKVVDENLRVIADSFKDMNHYNVKKMDFSHLMMENKVQGCTAMINKSFIAKLRQLPEKACMHDAWLGLIASSMGKIGYIKQPTMLYRQHSKNVKGTVKYWTDIRRKLTCLPEQKNIVFDCASQIKEFILIFGNELDQKNLASAQAFATLKEQNFLIKRIYIIKYHMWKSGFLRNMGLMLLI